MGALIGLLSSVIPYGFELQALRRMPARVFGIFMSMEPAIAALVGLVLLSESLNAQRMGRDRLRHGRQRGRGPGHAACRPAAAGLTGLAPGRRIPRGRD